MADIRGPDMAKGDYLSGMKYKDIAEKYQVSINTVKSWVKRYGWSKEKKQGGAPKNKKGAPLNNKNAVGHGAPAKNKNAETHGLFTKYLPEETLELMEGIKTKSPLDLLWDNIQIQYAAIIRSQRIMHVTDKDDLTKVLKREKQSKGDTSSSWEEEYELQFAWDKQANFLKAQSRAMGELRSMIKQYNGLLNTELATEEQKLRVKKLQVEINKIENQDIEKPIEIFIKRKGED